MNPTVRRALASFVFALSVAPAGAALPTSAPDAGPPLRLSFVPHAAFFSLRNKQPDLLDPEVFVTDTAVASGTFDHVAHAPGIRNALMSDDGTQPARDANGRLLGVTLQRWFSATGLIAFQPQSSLGAVNVTAQFVNLVPSGRYSLFAVRAESPDTLTPLDGNAATNSFTAGADGHADVTMVVPRRLESNTIVVLVFHSDGRDHKLETGAPAIESENQMVLRIP